VDNVWYFADHGRAQGPISTRELIEKIHRGELSLVDLVFKEGAGEWLPIEKYKELASQVNTTAVGTSSRDADWIVLRVIEVDGQEKYEQIGPYAVEQVLELIDSGKVKFNDFVWKTGFENWVPLGKLDKFDKPLASSVQVDKSLYNSPKKNEGEIKKATQVKAYSPKEKIPELREEIAPEGAQGPDLAAPKWAMSLKAESEVSAKQNIKPPAKSIAQEIFDFGHSITNMISPLKGPPKAPTDKAPGNPLKYEALDLGERTQLLPKNAPIEPFPVRKSKSIQLEPKEMTSTAIPPVVVTKVVAKQADKEASVDGVKPLVKNHKEEELPELPPAEAVEKMQKRWGKVVGVGAAMILVVGVGITGMMVLKRWAPKNETAADIAFEKHPSAPSLSQFEKPVPVAKTEDISEPQPQNSSEAKTGASDLPAPDMGLPPGVAQQAKKTEEAPKSVVKAAPQKEEAERLDVRQMSQKQKSFFHEQERMFIFYQSKKGLNLVNLYAQALTKKNKTPASWKKFYAVWLVQVKTLSGKVNKEFSSAKVHIDLFKSLKVALINLEKRGKDINGQMVSGRAPTKDPSVSDIIAEFKKINAKAKSLDQ